AAVGGDERDGGDRPHGAAGGVAAGVAGGARAGVVAAGRIRTRLNVVARARLGEHLRGAVGVRVAGRTFAVFRAGRAAADGHAHTEGDETTRHFAHRLRHTRPGASRQRGRALPAFTPATGEARVRQGSAPRPRASFVARATSRAALDEQLPLTIQPFLQKRERQTTTTAAMAPSADGYPQTASSSGMYLKFIP